MTDGQERNARPEETRCMEAGAKKKKKVRCAKRSKEFGPRRLGLHLLSSSRVVVHTQRGIIGLTDGPSVAGAEYLA